MEITKSLHDDIVKIQHELVTAIQNHQVLVLRQQVGPTDSIKTQIEEVQRHIICLGESQKILVSRLRNEVDPKSIRVNNNKHKTPHPRRPPHFKPGERECLNYKVKNDEMGRSLLVKNAHNRERSLLKTSRHNDSDHKVILPKERQPSVDSSSEENRTPCESPVNGNSDNDKKGVKRAHVDNHCQLNKRPKTTLQATPRPSSPAVKAMDVTSSSTEESLDYLMSQQPETENKIEFALALGLVTKEVYNKVIKKKSERRRRRVSSQHHLYNDLWDLTVLQKRSRLKEPMEDGDDLSRDCATPPSDSDSLCFVCRKPGTGEQRECRVCQTICHVSCVNSNMCPACTHQVPPSPLVAIADCHSEPTGYQRRETSGVHQKAGELCC